MTPALPDEPTRPPAGSPDAAADAAGDADRDTGAFDPRAIIARMREDYWQNLAAQPAVEPAETWTVVAFDAGPGFYGVPVSAVREVLKMPWVSRLPRTPEFLLGVVNVRGRILPVVDLRAVLSHPAREPDKDTRLISVRHGDAEVCLRADRVYGLTEFPADTVHDTPALASGIPRELIGGQVEIAADPEKGTAERLMGLLDVPSLLDHCAKVIGGGE